MSAQPGSAVLPPCRWRAPSPSARWGGWRLRRWLSGRWKDGALHGTPYCSVAVLQVMKEANVAIVFCFSCLVGLQVMNHQRLFIAWVLFGSSMCVVGDVHFVLVDFLLQAMSQRAECTRAVMAEWVLNGNDMKPDPVTYTLFVAPVGLSLLLIADLAT